VFGLFDVALLRGEQGKGGSDRGDAYQREENKDIPRDARQKTPEQTTKVL
jgi:hypothetical protein